MPSKKRAQSRAAVASTGDKHEVVTPIFKTIRGEEKRFGPGAIITDELNQSEREEMYTAGALRAYKGTDKPAATSEPETQPQTETQPATEEKPA